MNNALHKTHLLEILTRILSDSRLIKLIGFKGGTACYLFHNLPRFSVDLDFNLLDKNTDHEVHELVTDILEESYVIKEHYIKRNNIFFLVDYGSGERKLKIEISKKTFGEEYELKQFLGCSVPIMVKQDIFANKLCALTDRNKTASRDLFDINFFLKQNWNINETIIHQRTDMKLVKYLKFIEEFIVKKFPERKVLDGLGELIENSQKSILKKNLVSETLRMIKIRREILN